MNMGWKGVGDDMIYISVAEMAKKWSVSERTVREYCSSGRVAGSFMTGKTWNIPEDAQKPMRKARSRKIPVEILPRLKFEKNEQVKGGLYHKIQIEMTYNSNHIEGSRLSHEQTRYIYETNTIGVDDKTINVDDVVETVNHFRCIDLMIDMADKKLTEKLIKQFHMILKTGTSDSRKGWFAVGDYKKLENEVGNLETTHPENVKEELQKLLNDYNAKKLKKLDDLLEFHYQFERIHPFQDGNGRVGRLILFKECLCNNIVPFIIEDSMKLFYYRGLHNWKDERGYLRDTCLTEQDKFKEYLDYYGIEYEN